MGHVNSGVGRHQFISLSAVSGTQKATTAPEFLGGWRVESHSEDPLLQGPDGLQGLGPTKKITTGISGPYQVLHVCQAPFSAHSDDTLLRPASVCFLFCYYVSLL